MYSEKPDHFHLSAQDIEILRLMVDGKKTDEIGAVLGLNENTVEQHLSTAVHAVRESLDHF